jgi:hypothetical protein
VTCDEFQAACIALCEDYLSGGMSGIAHAPLMLCSDTAQMPLRQILISENKRVFPRDWRTIFWDYHDTLTS